MGVRDVSDWPWGLWTIKELGAFSEGDAYPFISGSLSSPLRLLFSLSPVFRVFLEICGYWGHRAWLTVDIFPRQCCPNTSSCQKKPVPHPCLTSLTRQPRNMIPLLVSSLSEARISELAKWRSTLSALREAGGWDPLQASVSAVWLWGENACSVFPKYPRNCLLTGGVLRREVWWESDRFGANSGGGAYLLGDLGQILSLTNQPHVTGPWHKPPSSVKGQWMPQLCLSVHSYVLASGEARSSRGDRQTRGRVRCCVSLGRLKPSPYLKRWVLQFQLRSFGGTTRDFCPWHIWPVGLGMCAGLSERVISRQPSACLLSPPRSPPNSFSAFNVLLWSFLSH